MPVKMRLARHGRKRYAYYHIVVADSRAPRDGRYIERIGSYNPNTDPAIIDLDFDKAYDWLTKGAQPTDTVRAILSYKGVLYKKHLAGGVKKGAFDEAEAENRLENWLTEKDAKIQAKVDKLAGEADAETKKQFEAETKIKEDRAAAIAAKNAQLAAEVEEADAETEEEVAEETEVEVAEVKAETEVKVAEETKVEVAEVKAEAEVKVAEETKVEVAEVKAEAEVKVAKETKVEATAKTEVKAKEKEAPKEGADS